MYTFQKKQFEPDSDEILSCESIVYDSLLHAANATRVADSLLNYSETAQQKMYALWLKAVKLGENDKRAESIALLLKSLKLAKQQKDFCLEARIYTNLSKQYRRLGFIDKGKDFITESLIASSRIQIKDLALKTVILANLELVEYDIESENYVSAVAYLKMAVFAINNESEGSGKYVDLARCEEKLARCYLGMGNDSIALNRYEKAKDCIDKSNIGASILRHKIYNGLIGIYVNQNAYDNAKTYVKKNSVIIDKLNNDFLKEHFYKLAAEYYKQNEVEDSSEIFMTKYKAVLIRNREATRTMVNMASNKLYDLPNRVSNNESEKEHAFGVLEIMCFVVLPSLGMYCNRKKIFEFVNNLKAKGTKAKRSILICSGKTESKILIKLKEFENSDKFLDSNMSLPTLVTYLNTNSKYLRYILKKHRGLDYNTYINKLRIDYVKTKLNSDSEYLNYKISFLAEVSGFSSHSKFSTNFKKFTAHCPSDYINKLKSKQT